MNDGRGASIAGTTLKGNSGGGTKVTEAGGAAWINSEALAVVPGEMIHVAIRVTAAGVKDSRPLYSYATPFRVQNYIPSVATNVGAALAHTWDTASIKVEGYVPHNGGSLILSAELHAIDAETGRSLEGEITLPLKPSHTFVPPPTWQGKRCRFALRCVNELGPNVEATSVVLTNDSLYIPMKWQFAPVRDGAALERLKRRLQGSNILDRTGSRYLKQLGLCIEHMPFGPESVTIREWLLRRPGVTSVAKSLGERRLPSELLYTNFTVPCCTYRLHGNAYAGA